MNYVIYNLDGMFPVDLESQRDVTHHRESRCRHVSQVRVACVALIPSPVVAHHGIVAVEDVVEVETELHALQSAALQVDGVAHVDVGL